jgi:hypothetical protein
MTRHKGTRAFIRHASIQAGRLCIAICYVPASRTSSHLGNYPTVLNNNTGKNENIEASSAQGLHILSKFASGFYAILLVLSTSRFASPASLPRLLPSSSFNNANRKPETPDICGAGILW